MNDEAKKLLTLLDIERLEVDLFRGIGSGGETTTRIFGGQVIAQALAAAYRTVPDDRLCHSLHAYFMRPGDPSIPVIYQVDRSRDGGSFTTRRVTAVQHGKQIFNLAASFQIDEGGYDFQHEMPQVEQPEDLPSRAELRAKYLDRVPEKWRKDFERPRPIELREIDPQDPFVPVKADDTNYTWMRTDAAVDQNPQMQHILLAYTSDMSLLGSSLRPHGVTWFSGEVMTASLDHAMWFHGPIDFNEWHLYAMDAPFTGKARGFNRGKVFSRDGRLVASVVQEGLVRPIRK